MKKTQLQKIKDALLKDGYVSRNWCLQNFITRLGARINDLKKEGYQIEGRFIATAYGKDYRYFLKKEAE